MEEKKEIINKNGSGTTPRIETSKPTPGSTGIRLTSLENIKKEIREAKKVEVTDETKEVAFEEIEPIAFQQVWKSYIEAAEKARKTFLLKILEAFPPELEGGRSIVLRVGNESQLHTIQLEREEMYYFLRKELDKKAIDLRMEVDKSKPKPENGRRPYTPKEKFEFLLQKNPKLKDLKDRLKLELDY